MSPARPSRSQSQGARKASEASSVDTAAAPKRTLNVTSDIGPMPALQEPMSRGSYRKSKSFSEPNKEYKPFGYVPPVFPPGYFTSKEAKVAAKTGPTAYPAPAQSQGTSTPPASVASTKRLTTGARPRAATEGLETGLAGLSLKSGKAAKANPVGKADPTGSASSRKSRKSITATSSLAPPVGAPRESLDTTLRYRAQREAAQQKQRSASVGSTSYTLDDYKSVKAMDAVRGLPASLPATGDATWTEKQIKMDRMKEFSDRVRDQHVRMVSS